MGACLFKICSASFDPDYLCNGVSAEIPDMAWHRRLMLFLCIKWFFSVKRTGVEIQSTDGASHGKEWNNACILVGDHGTAVNASPYEKTFDEILHR